MFSSKAGLMAVMIAASFHVIGAAQAQTASTKDASLFDTPKKVETSDLPPDPKFPDEKATLTCTTYEGFQVKEIDRGEVGAEITLIPLSNGAAPLPCSKDTSLSIKSFPLSDQWSGYFKGAKGRYVFIRGADGWQGGIPFAVFDAESGQKVLDDTYEAPEGESFKSVDLTTGGLRLTYRRIYSATCSLFSTFEACKGEIDQAIGLKTLKQGLCDKAYNDAIAHEKKRSAQSKSKDFSSQMPHQPSILIYDVQAVIADGKATTTPTSDKVACHFSE